MMMSLTICLINFTLLFLPVALNFNILAVGGVQASRGPPQHPQLQLTPEKEQFVDFDHVDVVAVPSTSQFLKTAIANESESSSKGPRPTQEANEEKLNRRAPWPNFGSGAGNGNLIFTWDPNEHPQIPFADDNDVPTTPGPPHGQMPKQGGGHWDHYYYCGPRGRRNNCYRLCRSLNYPRVTCGRNSCYCTW